MKENKVKIYVTIGVLIIFAIVLSITIYSKRLTEQELIVKQYLVTLHDNDYDSYLDYVEFIGFSEQDLKDIDNSVKTNEYAEFKKILKNQTIYNDENLSYNVTALVKTSLGEKVEYPFIVKLIDDTYKIVIEKRK